MAAELFLPDERTIRLFLLGRLAGAEFDRVQQYLEARPDVADTLHALAGEDTFTSALRDAPDGPVSAEISAIMKSLERMLNTDGDATTPATAGEESRPSPRQIGEDTEDALSFLAPAQSVGELGRLGGYRILKVLGQGGMGMVLDGEDTRLGRHVAIKVMRPRVANNPNAVKRFIFEAQAAARVEHDHVVPIFQVGEDNGVPFMVMPFLRGESLDAKAKREGRLPIPEVLRIGRETAEGLAAAHDQGLVHRDIKPANLWLEAPKGRVKILDFGLARVGGDETHLTQSGAIIGTPAYMSPEQGRGKAVDGRTDLFSLGAVLYRLVTGRQPFQGTDTMSMLMALATDAPDDPRTINPAIPPYLAAAILQMLEKDPAKRPQSARDAALLLTPPPEVEALPGAVPAVQHHAEFDFDAEAPTQSEAVATPIVPPARAKAERPKPAPAPKKPVAAPKSKQRLPAAKSKVVPRVQGPRSKRGLWLGIAAAVLLLGSFAAYKLVFETKDGTLVVEIADAATETRFKNGELQVMGSDGKVKYTLKPSAANKSAIAPGDYKVTVVGADGLALDTDSFTMKSGGQVTLRVTAVAPAGTAKVDPPRKKTPTNVATDAEWLVHRNLAEWVLKQPGGSIDTNVWPDPIRSATNLPSKPYRVIGVTLNGPQLPIAELVEQLRKVESIEYHMVLNEVTDADINRLAGSTALANGLRTLHLEGKVTDAGLESVKKFRKLRQFTLINSTTVDRGLKHLRELPELVNLNVRPITDAGVAELNGLNLDTIVLTGTGIADAGLARLKQFSKLGSLNLSGTAVSDAGLATLPQLPALEKLYLAGGNVSEAGLRHIADCSKLTDLTIGEIRVTEAGLAPLANCRSLSSLAIKCPGLTDGAVARLAELPSLRELYVTGAPITDAALEPIALRKELTNLVVRDVKVTAAGLRKLATEHPDCKIDWDGGAIVPETPTLSADEARKQQADAARYLGVPMTIENSVGMKLNLIPAGRFLMGSPDAELSRRSGESPVHDVAISRPYYLGIHEVTQDQYEAAIGTNPSSQKGKNLPAETVTRVMAMEFCAALSNRESERAAGRIYRLPTEAEWEYACRAGTRTAYSFGDDPTKLPDYAWFSLNDANQIHPVGLKLPNAWGLFDLHGNVWEYCSDFYETGYFKQSPRKDPTGPAQTPHVVIRGGAINNGHNEARSANRYPDWKDVPQNNIGFRVVCECRPPTSDHALRFEPKQSARTEPIPFNRYSPGTYECFVTPNTTSECILLAGLSGFEVAIRDGRWSFYSFHNRLMGPRVIPGKRVHVAGVRSDTQRKLYLDGRLVASMDEKFGGPTGEPAPLIVADERFVGVIDEVRISNVARYDKDFTPLKWFDTDADTLALYHCDEGRGDVLRDASGNGHDVKLTGATWVNAEPANVLPTGRTLDLLALVDPVKDAHSGTWRIEPAGLVSAPGTNVGLRLPATPLGGYEFRSAFTRESGKGSINVLLPVGSTHVLLTMDGAPGGLAEISGKGPEATGTAIVTGKRHELRALVRPTGERVEIEIELDGKPYLKWSGLQSALSVKPALGTGLTIGSVEGTTRFHSASLRPLDAPARLARPAIVPPAHSTDPPFLNDSDLAGWTTRERNWKVVDGSLIGVRPKGDNAARFLTSLRRYRDFELSFRARTTSGKGTFGIGVRSSGNDVAKGHWWTLNLGQSREAYTTIVPAGATDGTVRTDIKPNQFVDVTIRCLGKRLTATVNGGPGIERDIADIPAEGSIAWMIGPDADELIVRDVRFTDLNRSIPSGPWGALADATFWSPTGTWIRNEGIVTGIGEADLRSMGEYGNLDLILEYRGASNVSAYAYVRSDSDRPALEIGLLGANAGVPRGQTGKVAANVGHWNTLRIVATGPRLLVSINGVTTFDGMSTATSGRLGIRLAGGTIEIQNVRVVPAHPLAPSELPAHVAETVVVEGLVADMAQANMGKNLFLDWAGAETGRVLVFREELTPFVGEGSQQPGAFRNKFAGQWVRVTGKVETHGKGVVVRPNGAGLELIPAPDRERRAAEWLLSRGAHFGYSDSSRYRAITSPVGIRLPAEAIRLNNFRLIADQLGSDADLNRFRDLRTIDTVVVSETKLTDAGLRAIATLPELRALYVAKTAITDAGLKQLADSKFLSTVHASHNAVTDAGLEALRGLATMKELQVVGTKVTEAGVQAFVAAQPNCRVVWSGGTIEAKNAIRVDNALEFDGKSSYVDIPTLSRNEDGPITIEAFVTVNGTAGANIIRIEGKYWCQMHGWPGKNGATEWVPNGMDQQKIKLQTGTPALTPGQRAHVALQIDDKSLHLFIDGKKANTIPRTPGAAETGPSTGTIIGAAYHRPTDKVAVPFSGRLDEIRISNVIRYKDDFSPAAHLAPDKDTVALYHCDEGSGDVLTDSSGKGHHGKLVGTKWVPAIDADRRAATWIIENAYSVTVVINGAEQAFKYMSKLPTEPFVIRAINVNRCKVANDETLVCLQGLKHLTTVQITNCEATDKTLTYLTESKDLELMILYSSKVTDAGLETIAGFKKLKNLNITQLPVTEAAVKKLAAALPGCRIAWNGGAIEPTK